ncbi:hypothetical protein ALC56_06138 [Trachymyrmex septentrionalis]|uniref:Uncharacterized protein n=1 Tax=Trachymyrmex septentrionalis TaxID=34720 RepID=A0A195FGY0_9HYME|nr:hypothetical protein ALC56_06138 [Trachymyrmex septentrionalis]
MSTLTNKIALVTGACSGISKAVTEELVSKGLHICPGLVGIELNQQWLKENSRLTLKPKNVTNTILYYTHSGD